MLWINVFLKKDNRFANWKTRLGEDVLLYMKEGSDDTIRLQHGILRYHSPHCCVETRKYSNKFGISLTSPYLCRYILT